MNHYSTECWEKIATLNGLNSFESIWNLDENWFEIPNDQRGGWSGVSRFEFKIEKDKTAFVFVKRQENYRTLSWAHPIKGINTYFLELNNSKALKAIGVPALEYIHYSEREYQGKKQAVLISLALTEYTPLDEIMDRWQKEGLPSKSIIKQYMNEIAAIARNMHSNKIMQDCFFPKHLFVRKKEGKLDFRLIDLEKTKYSFTVRRALSRDLDTFNRRLPPIISRTHRLRFLMVYFQVKKVTPEIRKIWFHLIRRGFRKLD